MDIRASGQKDLYRLAHALHEAGEKGLKRELDKASREAGDAIAKAVQDNTKKYIPKDFEKDFDASLRTRVEVRLVASRKITVVFWADGVGGRRDIKRINEGKLRHPVFGRTRALKRHWVHKATTQVNPWVEQKITPGVVEVPAAEAMPEAIKKIEDAVDRVVQQIERNG